MPSKKIKEDKKIILNIANLLRKLYSDYEPSNNFCYSLSIDRKKKKIILKIERRS